MRKATVAWGIGTIWLALACAGGEEVLPPTDGAEEPVAKPEPAPKPDTPRNRDRERGRKADRRRKPESADCRQDLMGVLTGPPGWPTGDGAKMHIDELPIRKAPADDAEEIARFDRNGELHQGGKPICRRPQAPSEHCLSLDYAKNGSGLPVYALKGDWAEVAFGPGGSVLSEAAGTTCPSHGWVKLQGGLEVRTAGEAIGEDSLAHTLAGWNGVLFDGPAGAPRPSGFDGVRDLKVVGSEDRDGRTWLDVRLIEGHCGRGDKEKGRGWIPVDDDDGRLQVWFYDAC